MGIQSLTKEERDAFLDKTRGTQLERGKQKSILSARRKLAQRRVDIFSERLAPYVEERVDEVYSQADTKAEVKRYARLSFYNPLIFITNAIAGVAYKAQPTRMLSDASEADQEKFRLLLEEGQIAIKAKDWVKWAFVANLVVVVPRIIGDTQKRLLWEMYLPNQMEVIPSQLDPTQIACMAVNQGDGTVSVLDDQGWFTYDEENKLLSQDLHGLGIFPGVQFRLSNPVGDFFGGSKGESVVNATIEVGQIMATMGWVRQAQNRNVFAVLGEAETGGQANIPEGQKFDVENPIIINRSTSDAAFQVHDLNTSVKEFQSHISMIYDEITKNQWGIELSSAEAFRAQVENANAKRMKEIRDDQILFLKRAEKELMWKTALMLNAFDHPLRISAQLVREGFRIVFPPMDASDEMKRLEVWDKKIKLGLLSHIDLVLELFPEMSREQATEYLERRIEERKHVADFHASNNLSLSGELLTVAQLQGQQGGQASPSHED